VVFAWLSVNLIQGQNFEAVMGHIESDLVSLDWLLPLALIQALLVVGLTVFFRRVIDRRPFKELGFAMTPGWVAEALLGLALGFAAMLLIFVSEWSFGLAHIRPTSASAAGMALRLVGFAVMYMAVGLTEELMFRGYLLQTLCEWPGVTIAVLATSFAFGLLHACNPNVSPLALAHLVLAGLVFAYAYLVTARLWCPIAMHFSWNFFQGPIFGFPVSGVPPEGLLITETTGPTWLTGGSFGPEAGLIGLVALGLMTTLIWAWGRDRKKRIADHKLSPDD